MTEFSSRDVAKLLADINAAIADVQSVRSPAAKALRALDLLHNRGWKVVPAEPSPMPPPLQEELEIAEEAV